MASTASESTHYLDSSALIKLVVDEPETAALGATVADAAGIVSSEIALVEVPRAIQRLSSGLNRKPRQALFSGAQALLRGIAFVPITRGLLLEAGRFSEAWLRSLDAIHLASGLSIADDLDLFVTYDKRQAAAGEKAGLAVASPGVHP